VQIDMTKPAAKADDTIVGIDTHLLNGSPTPLPFQGIIDGNLSPNVLVQHKQAAMVDSTATNTPPHVPPPGKTFDKPPSNRGVIVSGSGTVIINDRAAARHGDTANTCNDPTDQQVGKVVTVSTVLVGK
jgi:uncharacterized Zn-binding protein involved in type VI secretion